MMFWIKLLITLFKGIALALSLTIIVAAGVRKGLEDYFNGQKDKKNKMP